MPPLARVEPEPAATPSPASLRVLPSPAVRRWRGGEGGVGGPAEPVCGAAHLTLPTLRLGPSLSPLKGGEGLVSTGIILVERDASRAIKFSSPDRPAQCGRG